MLAVDAMDDAHLYYQGKIQIRTLIFRFSFLKAQDQRILLFDPD